MTDENSNRANDGAPDGGFTLLELLVTLGIVALALAVSLPNLSAFRAGGQLRPLAAAITTELKRAHVSAMAQGKPVALILEAHTGSYRVEGSNRSQRLPFGTKITWHMQRGHPNAGREARITFYADGSASAGNLIIEDNKGQKLSLNVNPITGTVSQDLAVLQ